MASSKEYLDFILEQLSLLDGVSSRAMMGEYIIYLHGKVTALAMMPDADRELPYEGAKEMLLVDNVDDREFLKELLTEIDRELPPPKRKK